MTRQQRVEDRSKLKRNQGLQMQSFFKERVISANGSSGILIQQTLTSLTLSREKHDPELGEDTENNFAELLSEELKLREADALESQRRADMAQLEAKKVASQYQKEADKYSSGMETCEEAREKSETALAAQKKLTAMCRGSRGHDKKNGKKV